MNKFFIVGLLVLSVLGGGVWLFKTQIEAHPVADEAVALMEAGNFEAAGVAMGEYITWFRGTARDHYVYAVALIRNERPEIKKAVRHRRKAERMGYQVPEWFDNYVIMREAKDGAE